MIRDGAVKAGDRLPTEAELASTYGVSRTTTRRALDDMHREGLVTRQPGQGTFVAPPRLEAKIPHLRSITEEIESLGYRAGSINLSMMRRPADADIAGQLEIQPGEDVLEVKRIRTADGRPLFVGLNMINITRFPDLADQDYSEEGMFSVFRRVTGMEVTRVVQWMSASPASADAADHLELDPGDPVLEVQRVVFLGDGVPVEVTVGSFHGGIYKHYSEVRKA